MQVIEKPLVVSGHQIGVFLAYSGVEDEFIPEIGARVLPAPFFYEKKLYFKLVRRHDVGTKFWPNGGFEVMDESGALRCYDLDQVITHPQVIKNKKILEKMIKRAEKSRTGRRPSSEPRAPRVPGEGRRGRPALTPEEKSQREAEKATKTLQTGGRRGRPKSEVTAESIAKAVKSGFGKGRPKLTDEVKATRALAQIAQHKKTGGKRGRPKRDQ